MPAFLFHFSVFCSLSSIATSRMLKIFWCSDFITKRPFNVNGVLLTVSEALLEMSGGKANSLSGNLTQTVPNPNLLAVALGKISPFHFL